MGPHGPQVPPNSVTPKPTAPSAPYVPGRSPPAPDPYAGGGPALDGDWRPSGTARPESVALGLILTLCFGPLGLFYAIWGSRTQTIPCML